MDKQKLAYSDFTNIIWNYMTCNNVRKHLSLNTFNSNIYNSGVIWCITDQLEILSLNVYNSSVRYPDHVNPHYHC